MVGTSFDTAVAIRRWKTLLSISQMPVSRFLKQIDRMAGQQKNATLWLVARDGELLARMPEDSEADDSGCEPTESRPAPKTACLAEQDGEDSSDQEADHLASSLLAFVVLTLLTLFYLWVYDLLSRSFADF